MPSGLYFLLSFTLHFVLCLFLLTFPFPFLLLFFPFIKKKSSFPLLPPSSTALFFSFLSFLFSFCFLSYLNNEESAGTLRLISRCLQKITQSRTYIDISCLLCLFFFPWMEIEDSCLFPVARRDFCWGAGVGTASIDSSNFQLHGSVVTNIHSICKSRHSDVALSKWVRNCDKQHLTLSFSRTLPLFFIQFAGTKWTKRAE